MENILLTFLSPIRVDLPPTPYNNVSGEPTKTTNESAVRYLLQEDLKDAQISKIFIFASKLVRSDILYDKGTKKYYDEAGNTVTHLEYFKRRMKNFMPNVDECITDETIYPYDEDGNSEKNLRSVAEMAERIQQYARGKDIHLYADLTGGMRDINMMMLDVIRLLEYSGVKIEKLLYSNLTTKRVEELNDIYDLFQLISGVEEFVNFGSVEALNKYYNANADKFKKSDALKQLTDAMENFAESIKLCRFGQFKAAIQKLHDSINDFEADPQNIHDIFMARLIDKIREKYDLLIATRGEDDLKIIRWCIKHGYLQQALTLYTERVPKYLGNQKFITQTEEEENKLSRKLKGENKYFYLLVNYLNDDKNKEMNKFIGSINTSIEDLNHKYLSLIQCIDTYFEENIFIYDKWKKQYTAWQEDLVNFVNELSGKCGVNVNLQNETQIRLQLETLDKIYKDPQLLMDLSAAELSPINNIIESIKDDLKNQSDGFKCQEVIFKFFQTHNIETLKKKLPVFKVGTRIPRLQFMLNKGIFSINIPKKIFFDIMRNYFYLKDERNNSHHANNTAKFDTAKALEEFMNGGLDEIEDAEKKFLR